MVKFIYFQQHCRILDILSLGVQIKIIVVNKFSPAWKEKVSPCTVRIYHGNEKC